MHPACKWWHWGLNPSKDTDSLALTGAGCQLGRGRTFRLGRSSAGLYPLLPTRTPGAGERLISPGFTFSYFSTRLGQGLHIPHGPDTDQSSPFPAEIAPVSREGPTARPQNAAPSPHPLSRAHPHPLSEVRGRRPAAPRPPSRRIPTVRHFWKRQKGQRLRCVLSILQLWLSVHV